MTVPITVFGKPFCQGCMLTTKRLERHGLPFEYRDITTDPEAFAKVTALGYREAPVVVVGDMHWGGFRLAKLDRLGEIHAGCPDVVVLDAAARAYLEGAA
ncbi:glutaredoxin family protein [Nocardia sp. NPDC050697]|uniref:glutaredoxin family protein n=1 Tax=Nocardia sp. NPDC050697 TaxID=3155158 RepID=UPI0033E2ABBC